MYGAIPKAQLWIVPGGDHSPTAGASEAAFLETVRKFLVK
jgi:putative intracellular protease/amidase